jgi:glycogen operon protein
MELLYWVRWLVTLRREHPVFRRRRWFQGRAFRGIDVSDLGWFRPDGSEMTEQDWAAGFAKSLTIVLNGNAIASPDRQGRRIVDDSFMLLVNAHHEPLAFRAPPPAWGKTWQVELDTTLPSPAPGDLVPAEGELRVESRALVLLRRVA